MRCPNCGHEVSEGQAFCSNCGTRLPKTGDSNDDAPSGPESHSARPNICPFCGSALTEGSEFCPNCGKRIAGDGVGEAHESISHTQAMPVIPDVPQRREAVPAPPQNPYTPGADKQTAAGGHKRSKAPLVATGSAILVAIIALVVVMVLGIGPFAGTTTDTGNQNTEAVSRDANETETSNDNENASSDDTDDDAEATSSSNANASNSTSNTANTVSSTNANASSATQNDAADDSDTDSTLTSGSVSLTNGYVYNSNSTYGYSLRVPTTFTLSGSDANGNATLTDTASPCVITVSVDDNPNGYSVDEALTDASRGSTSGAYTAEGNGWYVFSDEPNGTVYYIMSYVRQGRTISLRFSYPTSAKSQCDPIIESVQPTFSVN